jgi:beta-glucosidase
VRGYQGTDYSKPDKEVASVKHNAAYGQPEGGRDHNTTDMSEQRLRNVYLPPFKAAIDASADTVMCSFNAINGVPGCGKHYTMTDILKGEWGFDGFVEADWAVSRYEDWVPCTPSPPRACLRRGAIRRCRVARAAAGAAPVATSTRGQSRPRRRS